MSNSIKNKLSSLIKRLDNISDGAFIVLLDGEFVTRGPNELDFCDNATRIDNLKKAKIKEFAEKGYINPRLIFIVDAPFIVEAKRIARQTRKSS